MEIVSFARYGYEGEIVKVEADLKRGIPAVTIVGLPDGAVREAMERMRAAIRNSGFDFPRERILINLSPADLKKEGSSFDLPIALAVLAAEEHMDGVDDAPSRTPGAKQSAGMTGAGGQNGSAGIDHENRLVMVLGELELSGTVRPVRGVLSAVSRGLDAGIRRFIVPKGNLAEAEIHPEASVTGVATLAEAIAAHRMIAYGADSRDEGGKAQTANIAGAGPCGTGTDPLAIDADFDPGHFPEDSGPDFEDVRGQVELVRALEIAAAGGHNLIAYGPPGCGKTLALKRISSIIPDLDRQTAITLTRICGIEGSLPDGGMLLTRPPFREPHPNASVEGIIGGGRYCGPGEISLAHGGFLFLDEAALFRQTVLQSIRAPLETGMVTVSRANRSATFPARFQLLMAVNPCPCGNYGVRNAICTCTPDMVEKHWRKLTAPLLDRIDLRISVSTPDPGELASGAGWSTAELRKTVARARRMQWERNAASGNMPGTGWLNAHLGVRDIEAYCRLGTVELKTFTDGLRSAGLSARAGHGVLRTARTIADLAGEPEIGEAHLREAIGFRRWNGMVPDFL